MAVAISSAGCHYTEEDSWKICCNLYIVRDNTSASPGRKTIIGWQWNTWFEGDGAAKDLGGGSSFSDTWKKRQIKSALTDFQIDNPGAPASAYFASLGMTCRPAATPPQDGAVRCEIELPVVIKCNTLVDIPFAAPLPKELRKPLPATLSMGVEVSNAAVLDVATRIPPLSGGRLCHP
jgi:hypothetical protein